MREIKFRVWNKDSKSFVKKPTSNREIETFSLFGIARYLVQSGYSTEPNNLVFQQFTGLHDKNGAEIHEGDIVKTPKSHMFRKNILVVEYHQNRFVPDDILDKDDVEVIGNIFENGDLLK